MNCKTCKWYETFFGEFGDEDNPEFGLCGFPCDRLPLSMAGVANRERECVPAAANNCPVWEAAA